MGTPEGRSTFPLLSTASLAFAQFSATETEINVGPEIGILVKEWLLLINTVSI